MTTEILRRGDVLGPTSQADGHLEPPRCASCDGPLESIDLVRFAYRCARCGVHTVNLAPLAVLEAEATSAIDGALLILAGLATTMRVDATAKTIGGISYYLERVTKAMVLLRDGAVAEHADVVHAKAIQVAARICASRAESNFHDSKNPVAGNEASKCAFAVVRLARRKDVADRLELHSPSVFDIPEAAHA